MTDGDPVLVQAVTASATNTSTSLDIFPTADIQPGQAILIAAERACSVAGPNGVSSISVAAGSTNGWFLNQATGVRSGNQEVSFHAAICATKILANTKITINYNTSAARKNAVLGVFTAVTSGAVETSSNNQVVADASVTSSGSNGASGTAMSTAASAANTNDDMLEFAMFTLSGTTGVTLASDLTEIGEIRTTVGTSDRGVIFAYKIVRTKSTVSAAATNATSGVAWAAAVCTIPIASLTPPPSTGFGSVMVGGVKKTVTGKYVIVGGVKKAVTSTSVIVGGVKKATT